MKKVIKMLVLFFLISLFTFLFNNTYRYIKIMLGYDKNSGNKKLNVNAEHFGEFNNFKKPTIICFSAPWCPACNEFRPIWKEFSNNNTDKETDIKTLDELGVDVVFFNYVGKNIELSDKYNIDAFPTIRLYHNDKVIEYQDEWSKEGLRNFVNNYMSSLKKA